MDRFKISPKKMALCKVSGGRSTSVDELQNLAFQTFSHEKSARFEEIFNQHISTQIWNTRLTPPAKTKRSLQIVPTPNSKVLFFAIFRAKQLVFLSPYLYISRF